MHLYDAVSCPGLTRKRHVHPLGKASDVQAAAGWRQVLLLIIINPALVICNTCTMESSSQLGAQPVVL